MPGKPYGVAGIVYHQQYLHLENFQRKLNPEMKRLIHTSQPTWDGSLCNIRVQYVYLFYQHYFKSLCINLIHLTKII